MAPEPRLIATRVAERHTMVVVVPDPNDPNREIEQIIPINPDFAPGEIDTQYIGAFPPKQVIGEWRDTSHQLLSSAGQASWAGGGQMKRAQAADGIDRYYGISSLETRFPGRLTLLALTQEIEGPNALGVRIPGDLITSAGKRSFVAFGTAMRELVGTFPNATLAGAYTLASVPSAKGVMFRDGGDANQPKLYIPQGSAGYQTFDGTTVDAQVLTIRPLNFAVSSRRLWAVDAEGIVWKSIDGVNWINVIQLEPGHRIRGVMIGPAPDDRPVPYVITDDVTFVVDENVPAIYETELRYAPHPYAGLAFESWRTDVYVAIGLGIQRYTLGTINAVGLDRDDGPGPESNGYVSTMCRGFNDLFFGLTPLLLPGGPTEEVVVDQGTEVYVGALRPTGAVMRLTGGQVPHTLWRAPEPEGEVTDLHVSSARDDYAVMWGWKGKLYLHQLSKGFDNPNDNPATHYMPEGELIGPWMDMGMRADRMTLASFEAHMGPTATATEYFELSYQIDDDDAADFWRPLDPFTAPHQHERRVGHKGEYPTNQTPKQRYDGQGFRSVRYRLRAFRDPADTQKHPELESITEVFTKRMRRLNSFTVQVDCSTPELDGKYGLGNRERRRLMQGLIDAEEFVPVLFQDVWRTVKFAIAQGPEAAGNDQGGDLTVSMAEAWEVPIGGA